MQVDEGGSNFELHLRGCPENVRLALIDVCDTAEMCERWFRDKRITFTAGDLVEMTKLVLAREVALFGPPRVAQAGDL